MVVLRDGSFKRSSVWNDDILNTNEKSKFSELARPGAKKVENNHWRFFRVIDERTDEQFLACDFPKMRGGDGFITMAIDSVEKPVRVRQLLLKNGARLEGNKKSQIEFVSSLCATLPRETVLITNKPGFRGPFGFVLGTRVLGDAKNQYRYKPASDPVDEALGARLGTTKGWRNGAGEVALKSSYLTFAICVALASPIPGYLKQLGASKIVAETATFNFVGPSGVGKTTLARLANSVFTRPDDFPSWQFTRRGFEDLAESRNNLLMVFDDTETCVDDGIPLKTAIRHVTQLIPHGRSKSISKAVARDKNLANSTWSVFGMTGSPVLTDMLFGDGQSKRSNGERVRFIDIPVPALAAGGIFDRLEGNVIDQSRDLAKKLDDAILGNYGYLFSDWLKVLFEANQSDVLQGHAKRFLAKVTTSSSDSYDVRFAEKFALIYAVGKLAVNAGLLPWPGDWPMRAVSRCYWRAFSVLHAPEALATKVIKTLISRKDDPDAFLAVKADNRKLVILPDTATGIKTQYRKTDVLAIRDETLRRIAGTRAGADAVLAKLKSFNAIVGGQGHAGTTQLPIKFVVDERRISKPRFWLLDADCLQAALKQLN